MPPTTPGVNEAREVDTAAPGQTVDETNTQQNTAPAQTPPADTNGENTTDGAPTGPVPGAGAI